MPQRKDLRTGALRPNVTLGARCDGDVPWSRKHSSHRRATSAPNAGDQRCALPMVSVTSDRPLGWVAPSRPLGLTAHATLRPTATVTPAEHGSAASPSSSPATAIASRQRVRSHCAAAGDTTARAGRSSSPQRTRCAGTRGHARHSLSASATTSVPMRMRGRRQPSSHASERDVLRQHLLGPFAEVLHRVLPLELSRVDYSDRKEHAGS